MCLTCPKLDRIPHHWDRTSLRERGSESLRCHWDTTCCFVLAENFLVSVGHVSYKVQMHFSGSFWNWLTVYSSMFMIIFLIIHCAWILNSSQIKILTQADELMCDDCDHGVHAQLLLHPQFHPDKCWNLSKDDLGCLYVYVHVYVIYVLISVCGCSWIQN